jgi:hypothetical protein
VPAQTAIEPSLSGDRPGWRMHTKHLCLFVWGLIGHL